MGGDPKALASAIKVIARADDSSGIIGDACRRLLQLHPKAAASARVPSDKVIDWMIKFQFAGEVDYFHVDPVQYAPALGEVGISAYRARLREIEASLGPRPNGSIRSRCYRSSVASSSAAGTKHAQHVEALVAELRETHRRRPRLQQEFDRAGLP